MDAKKRRLLLFLCAAVLIPTAVWGEGGAAVSVYVNGMNLAASQYGAEEVAPIREGRTYLSLANCEDFFGYTVEQSGDGAVTLRAGDKQIAMKIARRPIPQTGTPRPWTPRPSKTAGRYTYRCALCKRRWAGSSIGTERTAR
ncbi:hypothetical protein QO008_000661 [Peptoniphilus ivorii]|uniref:hypothetical protein n=1 Tax=Aedoeadaptatus ivorii TaxID=54006 RepID=UPI002780EC02|nr:hypothetical protein [Peptoniphilus ivorii]MDQ0508212.1 hypothetical protein [Peptoniphilus ivorii]